MRILLASSRILQSHYLSRICHAKCDNILMARFQPVIKERKYSSNEAESSKQTNKQDQQKVRRAYALGGCLIFIWLSTHGILLYRRRSEYRSLNEKMPPIPWPEFVDKYLIEGQVKTIVYQPQFEIGNVYLHNVQEQMMKKTVLNIFHATPDKFSRPPDVRFYFEGNQTEMEAVIHELQKEYPESPFATKGVEISIDQFPSYRELAFIIGSTLFTGAAMMLVK